MPGARFVSIDVSRAVGVRRRSLLLLCVISASAHSALLYLVVYAVVEWSAVVLLASPVAAIVLRRILWRLRSAMSGRLLAVPGGSMTSGPRTDARASSGRRERRQRYPSLREGRRRGPRLRARFASAILTLAMVVVMVVGHAIVPLVGSVVAMFVLGPQAILAYRRARQHGQRSAAEELVRDGRRPVVLLRAFADDAANLGVRTRWSMRRHWVENLLLREEHAEEVVARSLWKFGPVLALGRPQDALPVLGAVRVYVPHQDWQTEVRSRMCAARLIVIVLGEGEGLRWEIQELARLGYLPKTLLVFPPNRDLRVWEQFRHTIGQAGLEAPELTRIPLVVRLDASQATAIFGVLRTEWHYEVALDAAIAGLDRDSTATGTHARSDRAFIL